MMSCYFRLEEAKKVSHPENCYCCLVVKVADFRIRKSCSHHYLHSLVVVRLERL